MNTLVALMFLTATESGLVSYRCHGVEKAWLAVDKTGVYMYGDMDDLGEGTLKGDFANKVYLRHLEIAVIETCDK